MALIEISNYRSLRKRFVTVSEFNKHLDYVKKTFRLIFREKSPEERLERNAFIVDRMVNVELTYKKGDYACTYITRKDGESMVQTITGVEAFRTLSKYYKVPRMPEEICKPSRENGLSASPLLWFNPKFNNSRNYAYGYDMNSAYAYAMTLPMPDTSKPKRIGYIREGKEIGFQEILNPKDDQLTVFVPMYKGFSQYIFPLMESPFIKFVDKWYTKKKTAKERGDVYEFTKAKNMLTYSVGYLQRVNPFLRCAIIGACNNIISNLIDENTTLSCNTDSIVSLKPLNLNIGNGLGEWKLEHEGLFAYRDYCYQWDDGSSSFRGIPKKWFPKGWDLLCDPIPTEGNIYKFNPLKVRVERENLKSATCKIIL